MVDIVSKDYMKKHKCKTKTHKCKYLKLIHIKDIEGKYRTFYQCTSEEELACGCCRKMEEIKND